MPYNVNSTQVRDLINSIENTVTQRRAYDAQHPVTDDQLLDYIRYLGIVKQNLLVYTRARNGVVPNEVYRALELANSELIDVNNKYNVLRENIVRETGGVERLQQYQAYALNQDVDARNQQYLQTPDAFQENGTNFYPLLDLPQQQQQEPRSPAALQIDTQNRPMSPPIISAGLPMGRVGRRWSDSMAIIVSQRWSQLPTDVTDVLTAFYPITAADVNLLNRNNDRLMDEPFFVEILTRPQCNGNLDPISYTDFVQIPAPFVVIIENRCYEIEGLAQWFANNRLIPDTNLPVSENTIEEVKANFTLLEQNVLVLEQAAQEIMEL